MMMWGVWLNLILCFFNLIPIPPLDGSHLFYYVLPPGLGAQYRSIQRFGILPLLAIMLLAPSVFHWLLGPAYYGMGLLQHLMLPYAGGDAWNIFNGCPRGTSGPRPPLWARSRRSSFSSTHSRGRSTCCSTSSGRSRSRSPTFRSRGSATSSSRRSTSWA